MIVNFKFELGQRVEANIGVRGRIIARSFYEYLAEGIGNTIEVESYSLDVGGKVIAFSAAELDGI